MVFHNMHLTMLKINEQIGEIVPLIIYFPNSNLTFKLFIFYLSMHVFLSICCQFYAILYRLLPM